MIVLVTVLSVLGLGYVRSAAHEPAAPLSPAGPAAPRAPAGDSRFTAEAAIALAQLQRKVARAYTHPHLWQAASALSATIGFMHATGSRAYLSDLSATYQAHHRGDTFRDHYDRLGGAADQAYMRRNAVTVWTNDRRGSSFGVDWAGPYHASTITAQASALDVLTTQIPALAGPDSP